MWRQYPSWDIVGFYRPRLVLSGQPRSVFLSVTWQTQTTETSGRVVYIYRTVVSNIQRFVVSAPLQRRKHCTWKFAPEVSALGLCTHNWPLASSVRVIKLVLAMILLTSLLNFLDSCSFEAIRHTPLGRNFFYIIDVIHVKSPATNFASQCSSEWTIAVWGHFCRQRVRLFRSLRNFIGRFQLWR